MDFEVEDSINRLEESKEAAADRMEEPPTLTIAERREMMLDKREKFYKRSVWAAVVFCVFSVLLMAGFKFNEGFFDANSRISLLMERLNEEQEKLSYPKINVRADFIDEPLSRLALRVPSQILPQNVSVREEFTHNKIVLTLSDVSDVIGDGINIVTDSQIMDAVGIYRQDTDVVVEVYCKDMYSWTLENNQNEISLSFGELAGAYDDIAVVYLPYEDKNRLVLSEWQQTLAKAASDNGTKLFLSYNMQEEYTEEDIVGFANRIGADMLIGISVETSAAQSDTSGITIYNGEYFIPDFASTQLAIFTAENFIGKTGIRFEGFRECGEEDTIVSRAVIPATFMEITQPLDDYNNVEASYKLNESIVEALKDAIGAAVEYTGGLE